MNRLDKTQILAHFALRIAADAHDLPLVVRLTDAACSILGVDGVSITVEPATDNRLTLHATDDVAAQLEELQDVLAEGPCWQSYLSGSPVSADLSDETDARWPQFSAAARDAVGHRTLTCLPVRPANDVLAVLSTHQRGSTSLAMDMDGATFLAATIGAALLQDPQGAEPDMQSGPWSARLEIHQATGMIMGQLGIDGSNALALLRAHAFAQDTTVDAIAAQILDRALTFREEPL